jgi:histidine triad (HIT) family protein
MDIKPITEGQVMIIPKKHYRWVWDVPKYDKYLVLVKKIALAQRKAFDTDWVTVNIFGEEVPHAHIWVYPQKKGGPLKTHGGLDTTPERLKELAAKIRKEL